MSVNLQNVICALSWKPTCCLLASANTKNELVFWWWGSGCTTSAPKKVVQQSSIHAYFLSFSSRSPSVLLYILLQVLSVDIVPICYLTVLWDSRGCCDFLLLFCFGLPISVGPLGDLLCHRLVSAGILASTRGISQWSVLIRGLLIALAWTLVCHRCYQAGGGEVLWLLCHVLVDSFWNRIGSISW